MPDTPDRIPPQALEAEQSILGMAFFDAECRQVALELLKPSYFYDPRHRKIFAAIRHLANEGIAIDQVTIADRLKEVNEWKDIGIDYLYTLAGYTATPDQIAARCQIVIRESIRNHIINELIPINRNAYDPGYETDNLLENLEGVLQEARNRRPVKDAILPLKSLTTDVIEHLRKVNAGEIDPGLYTGLTDLDRLTLGLQPEDLIIIGARPSVGKTSLARNIIEHVVLHEKTEVLLFSVEMARRVIVEQMLCSKARVSHHDLKSRKLINWDAILEAERLFNDGSDLHIDGSPAIRLSDLRMRAGHVCKKHKIGLIVIDYLQLVIGPDSESLRVETNAISAGFKAMARELKIPVMALSQLRRLDKGKDRRPELADLKESGNIEADADVVVLIHRPANDHGIMGEKAEIIVAKQRIGPTAVIDCRFIKEITRFEMATKEESVYDQ